MTWDIVDRFDRPDLDPDLWIPHYLPHWTTPDRSGARYRLTDEGLELRIEHDQPAWRAADGTFRVSHVQTGHRDGQHRVGSHLTVVSPRPPRTLWAPRQGVLEVVASASTDPACMLGIWLLGDESAGPRDSGEICVAELFGSAVGASRSTVRTGIKAHHDPRLVSNIRDVELPIDATAPHTYGARWGAHGCEVSLDGTVIFATDQVLDYPLQLMLDLWEFPEQGAEREADSYPKAAAIHEVRLRMYR